MKKKREIIVTALLLVPLLGIILLTYFQSESIQEYEICMDDLSNLVLIQESSSFSALQELIRSANNNIDSVKQFEECMWSNITGGKSRIDDCNVGYQDYKEKQKFIESEYEGEWNKYWNALGDYIAGKDECKTKLKDYSLLIIILAVSNAIIGAIAGIWWKKK